jgi:HlyD family secretion protein
MKSAAISFLAASVVLAGCAHGGPPGGMMGGFSFPVSAAPLTRGDIVQTFSVTGSVNPLLSASLSSVVSGTVMAVNAQIGEHVSKGELLVQIDDSTLQAQLQQNEAALEASRAKLAQTSANDSGNSSSMDAGLASAEVAAATARANLVRNRALFRQGFVSQSALDDATQQAAAADAALRAAQVAAQNAQLDPNGTSAGMSDVRNARAAVDQSAAAVNLIEAQIAQTEVRAPFDGVVTARDVDPGTLASPGTTLMEVDQLDLVYVNAGISGDALQSVHVGTPATVSIATIAGRTWTGKVQYLNLASEPGTLTYLARISIPNPDLTLRGGMVASVAFEQARKSGVILAPRAAVYQTDTGYAMYIIGPCQPPPGAPAPPAGAAPKGAPKMQCAALLPVETGLENDQVIEVSGEGLKPGIQAILNHPVTLQPGMPVQAIPAQNRPHA